MARSNKSLFDLIKEVIITHTPKDVIIHQRPLATELIYSEKKSLPLSFFDFLPRKQRGKNWVLTRYLIFILRTFILILIAILYISYNLIHKLVTGTWRGRRLKPQEIEASEKRNWPDGKKPKWIMRLWPDKEKTSTKKTQTPKWLYVENWCCIPTISGLNTIIFFAAFIMAISTLIFGTHFLIKEIVLPDNDSRINSHGVVSIDQGCLEEQHFFLLNAATFWTNTGIAVSAGDEVYITASGSMYSDVDEMANAAEVNKNMLYPRSDFNAKYDYSDRDVQYCIYGRYCKDSTTENNKPQFGSLLYQIGNETNKPKSYNDSDDTSIVQINFKEQKGKKYSFKAKKSGILYFCFNDILLDNKTIDTIFHDKITLIKDDLLKLYHDTIHETIDAKKTKRDTINWLKDNVDPQIWFQDNLGEALINVRVIKNIGSSNVSCYKKVFISFYRTVDSLYKKTRKGCWYDFYHSNLLKLLLIISGWLVIDILISRILKTKKNKPNNTKNNDTQQNTI